VKATSRSDEPGRKPRCYDGWTQDAIKALRKLLNEHPPVWECALRTRNAQGRLDERFRIKNGDPLRHVLEAVAEYLRKALSRAKYAGFWGVLVERGQFIGWHLHVWLTEPPTDDFVELFGKWWNRTFSGAKGKREAQICFKGNSTRDQKVLINYLGKEQKGAWDVKRPWSFYGFGAQGNFKPYRFGNCEGSKSKTTVPRPPADGPFPTPDLPASRPASLIPSSSGAPSAVDSASIIPAISYRERCIKGSDEGSTANHSAANPVSTCHKIGLRFAPRYGRNDEPIPCPLDYARDTVRRLSLKYRVLDVCQSATATDCTEVLFSVPPHSVRDFEIDATPHDGWGILIRE